MFAIVFPQLAAFLAAFLVTWAASKGITLSQTEVAGVFVGVFKVVEGALKAKANPGNVAAPALVEPMKREANVIQETEKRARAAKRANEPRG